MARHLRRPPITRLLQLDQAGPRPRRATGPSRSECPDTGPVMPAAVARLATIARTLRTFQGLGAHHVTPGGLGGTAARR